MKKMMFLLMMAFPLMVSSCTEAKMAVKGDGRQVTDNRNNVKGFEAIEINGSMDVIYRQANTYQVSVRGPQKLVREVVTTVDNGQLKISYKKNRNIFFGSKSDDVTVVVSSPDLVGVFLKGSGDFKCAGHLDTDNMKVHLRGSGDMEFQSLICDNLQVTLEGSGDIEMKEVTARQSSFSLMGSGDLDVMQRQVDNTQVDLKGSGDIELKVVDCGSIESEIMGSGDISIEGTARQEHHSVRGTGDVHTHKLFLQ